MSVKSILNNPPSDGTGGTSSVFGLMKTADKYFKLKH